MNALRRLLTWTFWIVLVLLSGGLAVSWFLDFRQDDQAIAREFAGQSIRPVVHHYTVGDRSIRFVETTAKPPLAEPTTYKSAEAARAVGLDDPTRPTVIFVHGAPSSLSFFNDFFKDTTLLRRARLVAVDRPGYGYSDFGRVETSIIRQAELLQPLIDRYKQSRFLVLVGSSYGGSVVARLAMNNPARPAVRGIDHVVFVSSALGPGLERTYGISYWIDKPPVRWLIPTLLRLANDEKLAHRQALEAILPDWPKITAGITMLHGKQDDLVYPTNVAFAQHQLVNAPFKQFLLPESRHDIVFKKREYMTDIILNVLAQHQVTPTPVRPMTQKRMANLAEKLALENVISVLFKL